jgi:hypothetical protein
MPFNPRNQLIYASLPESRAMDAGTFGPAGMGIVQDLGGVIRQLPSTLERTKSDQGDSKTLLFANMRSHQDRQPSILPNVVCYQLCRFGGSADP